MFHSEFQYTPYVDEKGEQSGIPVTQQIYGPVYYIGEKFCCAYLIHTNDGLVIVDTLEENNSNLLINNIVKLGFEPKDIKLILNTHWHPDHVGGNAKLIELSSAQVMIHEKDATVLETGVFLDRKQDFSPVQVNRRLKDNDRIDHGGLRFETIFCPGQSFGEVVFLVTVSGPDGPCRVCFAGDAHGFKSSVGTYKRWGYPGAAADYRKSVPILKELQFDLFCGGHPHMITKEVKGSNSPFISHETWVSMVEHRHASMERFVADHPEYDQI